MDIQELHKYLRYDKSTGIFFWKVNSGARTVSGKMAGTIVDGYVRISVKRKQFKAHRIAWLFSYGEWPINEVDHINSIRNDNRIENLRLARKEDNQRNVGIRRTNTSGYRGVCFHKESKRWRAQCWVNGKRNQLGSFDTAELASNAYESFVKVHHGNFYRPVRDYEAKDKP